MGNLRVLLIGIVVIAQSCGYVQGFTLPCNLEWKQADFTSLIGDDWISLDLEGKATSDSQYIFRVKNANEEEKGYYLGTVTPSFDPKGSIYKSSVGRVDPGLYEEIPTEMSGPMYTYEILTNPYSCKLKWERCKWNSDLKSETAPVYAQISSADAGFVGKFRDFDDGREIVVPINDDTRDIFGDAALKCLKPTATTKLNITQFTFTYPQEPRQTELLGFDALENNAEVKVTQIISHRKISPETFEFTQDQSWSFLDKHDLKVLLDINQKSIVLDNSHIVRLNGKAANVKEFRLNRETISSRQISVPPMYAIQACSTVTVDKNVRLPYTAQGRFFAPGVAVSSLEREVRKLGYNNLRVEGSYVVANIAGTLLESMGGGSAFYTSPAEGELTCGVLADKIEERNRLQNHAIKSQGMIEQLGKVEEDIQRITSGLSGLP